MNHRHRDNTNNRLVSSPPRIKTMFCSCMVWIRNSLPTDLNRVTFVPPWGKILNAYFMQKMLKITHLFCVVRLKTINYRGRSIFINNMQTWHDKILINIDMLTFFNFLFWITTIQYVYFVKLSFTTQFTKPRDVLSATWTIFTDRLSYWLLFIAYGHLSIPEELLKPVINCTVNC